MKLGLTAFMKLGLTALVFLLGVVARVPISHAQGPFVSTHPVIVQWKGTLELSNDRELPSYDVILDQKELEELWKDWFPQAPVPVVNFRTHLVVYGTSTTSIITDFRVGDHAAVGKYVYLRPTETDPPKDFQGFSYAIGVIEREPIQFFGEIKIPPLPPETKPQSDEAP